MARFKRSLALVMMAALVVLALLALAGCKWPFGDVGAPVDAPGNSSTPANLDVNDPQAPPATNVTEPANNSSEPVVTPPPAAVTYNKNMSVDRIREIAKAEGCQLSVALIHANLPNSVEINDCLDGLETYGFVKSIYGEFWVDGEGPELYCLIATDPNAKVVISQFDATANGGKGGVGMNRYLTNLEGSAMLVKGNVSETMPSYIVQVYDASGNVVLEYTPSMSLKDGSVNTVCLDGTSKVLDFSL
ncbi:MAG: hypothetical protein IJH83_07265 [Coriobacteriales bacterium]|nr:hypothetical protein [Coriobacteriales bacterium]